MHARVARERVRHRRTRPPWSALVFLTACHCTAVAMAEADPLAANNTLYPPARDWSLGFRPSNYDYPSRPVKPTWPAGGPDGIAENGLTPANAAGYVSAVKAFLEEDIRGLIDSPLNWTPDQVGWFDMPWGGQGARLADGTIDPESGREALLGSYTGQMGSVVVKVEAATLTPGEWAPLTGSSVSYAYRPTTASLLGDGARTARVIPLRFSQMAVKIKDGVASPQTGWVFIAFAYDRHASGASVWEKTVPVGATWGNDPELADDPSGRGEDDEELRETWVSPDAPPFVHDTLGWGGRLAGPMDLARRHNVVTVSGKRFRQDAEFGASSCLSCHSTAQFPFVANLYPSPNTVFPEDGTQFLMFDPGSPQWAKWYRNLLGNEPLSGAGRGIAAMDYDLLLTFSLEAANAAVGSDDFLLHRVPGH